MIEEGFFRSRHFLVAAIVAGLLLAGAAGAYRYAATSGWASSQAGCTIEPAEGSALALADESVVDDDGRRRSVTYRLDAAQGFDVGALRVCSGFGSVLVEPSHDGRAEIVFEVRADDASAVERTQVRAEAREAGGALHLAGSVPTVGRSGDLFGEDTASVRVTVRLPALSGWSVDARSSHGSVNASGILANDLKLASAFGRVSAYQVDLQGNATLSTSHGAVLLDAASVATGTLVARSDFGRVEVKLPQRADVGYDVVAESDFGRVDVEIGPTESSDADAQRSGERETARSVGYASKPTQVVVRAESSHGAVTVVADGEGGSA